MKAILLCAGYATRLYPLTRNQPKPLLPIGGKPILEYLLEKLVAIPFLERVFLVTNDRFYPPFENWAQAKHYPWQIEVINDGTRTNETRLGAMGDLAFLLRKFDINDDLGIFAGDNLFHSDLQEFLAFAESHRPHVSVGVVDIGTRDLAHQYGVVQLGPDGGVVEFLEKPEKPTSTLASMGVYWFPKESLKFLDTYTREGHNADRPGDYISWLVKVDRVFAYRFLGCWYDIGDLRSYREADRLFSKGRMT